MFKSFPILSVALFMSSTAFAQQAPLQPLMPTVAPTCSVRFMAPVDYVSLNEFLDKIVRPDVCIDSKQILKIKIQSGGGAVDEMVYTYLQLRARGNIETQIDFNSASAAVLMFLAGDKRIMKAGSTLLVHRVAQNVQQDFDDDSSIEELRTGYKLSKQRYEEIVADRTHLSIDHVKKIMEDRTYLSAEDALKLGFATEIVP